MKGIVGQILCSTRDAWFRYKEDRMAVIGLIGLVLFIFTAILAPYVSPFDPFELSNELFQPPSSSHLMGTDNLRRDVLSRVLWGTRVSLLFAVCASGMSLMIGVLMGGLADYLGGVYDDIIFRIIDLFLLIPTFFSNNTCRNSF